ncbi:hypothetical protein [Agromyces salentinus]|uniref:Type III PLP-dependent enzyme n=1 Tax=Agromyces salentinus TaxID=269421 RepID=A0ABN2MWR1_9MICO|nr:hypothetical protein [Agromyces salentinus]
MTVTTTEHGRHAEDGRTATRRSAASEDRREARRVRADRRARASRGESAPDARVPASPGEAERPPHRELVRRDLAERAHRIGLLRLVEEHGTPLVVLDPDRVTAQLLELRHHLPGVELRVAVDSLPHPALIRAVDAFGATFDVGSRHELDRLEGGGVALGGCVHTRSSLSTADLTGAYLRGIRTFVLDDPAPVGAFAGLPADARLLVRLAAPAVADIGDGASAAVGLEPAAARDVVARCRRAGRHVAGFTVHVGGRAADAGAWAEAIGRALALMRTLERESVIGFDTLALAGDIPLAEDASSAAPPAIVRAIRDSVAAAPSHCRVSLQPGRFVTAPAMTLVNRVVGTSATSDRRWVQPDGDLAAASGSPSEAVAAFVFAASELEYRSPADGDAERAIRRLRERAYQDVTLTGGASDGARPGGRALRLPPLSVGDLLVSPGVGSDARGAASDSARGRPARVHVLADRRRPART